jgi:hypothetical protein
MSEETKTITITMQEAADIGISLSLAALAGVIPRERAFNLVDKIYAAYITMIKDTLNGEEQAT